MAEPGIEELFRVVDVKFDVDYGGRGVFVGIEVHEPQAGGAVSDLGGGVVSVGRGRCGCRGPLTLAWTICRYQTLWAP